MLSKLSVFFPTHRKDNGRSVQEQPLEKRNRRLGLILGLLFVGLFAMVTTVIVTGNKAPPIVEEVVKGVSAPVLGGIGLLLLIVAVVEIVLRIGRSR